MLRRSSAIVAHYHRRATEAAERAALADNPSDKKFWMACEQRWLDLVKSQHVSERLSDYIESQSARERGRKVNGSGSFPTPEETLRLVEALNTIKDPGKLAELIALAEELAADSPIFAALQEKSRSKH